MSNLTNDSNITECRYNVIDYIESNLSQWILLAYVTPCFVIVGLIGNTLTLITLNASVNKQTMKPSLFLSAKAVADLVFCIFALLFNLNIYSNLISSDSFDKFYYHWLQKPVIVIMNFLLMTSTWYAVAVTCERTFAVLWPLQARHVLTTRRITVSIAIIAIISFITTVYPLFFLTNITVPDCKRPWKQIYGSVGPLSKEQPVLWWYGIISRNAHHVLATIIPVLLLPFFNSALVWHLRMHRRSMARFAQAGYNVQDAKEQMRVTFVVFSVTAATAVFLTPSALIVFYDSANRGRKSAAYGTIVHFTNFLVLCDKVLDFFLYCLVSSHFRSQLVAAWQFFYDTTGRRKSSSKSLDTEMMTYLKRGSKDTIKVRPSI